MKKWLQVMLASAILGVACCALNTASYAADQAPAVKAAGKAQTLCPIMGDPINKKLYVDHAGKRLYVCCKMCVMQVQKDPAKYIKQLEDEGIELEKTPAE